MKNGDMSSLRRVPRLPFTKCVRIRIGYRDKQTEENSRQRSDEMTQQQHRWSRWFSNYTSQLWGFNLGNALKMDNSNGVRRTNRIALAIAMLPVERPAVLSIRRNSRIRPAVEERDWTGTRISADEGTNSFISVWRCWPLSFFVPYLIPALAYRPTPKTS